MKVVAISEFMDYLQENDLVIVPAKRVGKDKKSLQNALVRKTMVSYKEIADSCIWGDVSQKRVYQIAIVKAKRNEIISVGNGANPMQKISVSGVVRIAKERGTYLL